MKQKVFFFFLFFLLPLTSFAGWGYLPSTAFKDIKLKPKKDLLQVVFHTTGWFRYKTFYLKKKKSSYCLVVDIWPVYLPKGSKTRFYFQNAHLKLIKVAQYNPRTVRAVVYLDKRVLYQAKRQKSDLILTLSIPAKKLEKAKLNQKVCIKDLKVRKLTGGLQIVLKTNGRPYYKDFILPAIASEHLPSRLVVDIWPAYLPKGFRYSSKIQHTAIKKIKIAQFNKQTVRLVIILKQKTVSYEITFLNNELCLTTRDKSSQKTALKINTNLKQTPVSLPQVFGLKIRKVVLDPGHGGKDPGAIGYRGLKEKDITLKLAKLVKEKLEKRLGCVVILTRTTDRFVSLEDRAKLANKVKADLFVSIHCNACPSHRLHGIETFFLGFTNDKRALEVAMRENATVNRRMSELDRILQELLVHAKIKESAYLAADVQEGVVTTLKGRYNPVTDLGVKQAPFYVLVGTKMPAILIETGFIDHRKEGRRFRDPRYLNLLAEGIYRGIVNYIKRTEQAYRYVPIEAGKGG